jgi:hypothetical protein
MSRKAGAERVPVDELAVRDAVIANGLMLIPLSNDQCELHAIHGGYAHCFGTALRTSDALRIVDELDVHPGRGRWPARTARARRCGGGA